MEQRHGKLLVVQRHQSIVVKFTPIANTIIVLKEPAVCNTCGNVLKAGSLVKRQIVVESYRKETLPVQKHIRYCCIGCNPKGYPRNMKSSRRLYGLQQ